MRAVIMGPPGAGKGTQADVISSRFEMSHLSSGEIFRNEKESGSELGKEIASVMDRGELVADDLVVEMMLKAINNVDGGLLLDGFPRTVAQAKALDDKLQENDLSIDAVIKINVDDAAIVKRITGRRFCPECGKGFHIEFMPSARGEYCDVCDGDVTLSQRDDDTEIVVAQRLESYRNQTKPVVDYYRQSDRVAMLEIDGMQSPDGVSDSISKELSKLMT